MAVVLLTGSAGFIGFYVAKALMEEGDKVIGLDNYNAYYAPELKRARTQILLQYDNFIPVEADIANRELVRRCFEEHSPDLVFHSAAQAGVRYSLVNPYAYQESNLQGFINLIEESRIFSVKRFVYASSSSVYGGNTKMPYSEDDPVNSPVSLYAATKRSNELIAYSYTHLWDLQTIGLRFFTVYGAWGRPDMAYWSFLEAILNNEPIKVFNYGKNRRDFTYIDDIVAGVVSALKNDGLDRYEIINLGNNKPVELMDFIEMLERYSGTKAVMEMKPPQPGDVVATYADIRKAEQKLGFHPKTDLKCGLERFVKWYVDHRDLADAVRGFRKGR
jgi:UDP-glucuronate 4-epimerase